jgi:SM-20-related protein
MNDLLVIQNFLDAALRAALLTELQTVPGDAAVVYGKGTAGRVDPNVRQVARLAVAVETRDRVRQILLAIQPTLEAHFGVRLTGCEEPQFLRYRSGNFFVAHQDGNTPLIHDDSRWRRVSVVIFMNAQAEEPAPQCYGGGALVLHGSYKNPCAPLAVGAEPGTLVAFRAETTHEVMPVTYGERYTIVSWFRCDTA